MCFEEQCSFYPLHFKDKWCISWQCRRFRRCDAYVQFDWYSKNYKKTTDSLFNYYREEPDNDDIRNSESFKYKTNITGNTPDNDNTADAEIIVPLQHLSN